ncbi:MAG: hypothetical protein JXR80_00070 [Deltaproteobacteria bacterium]|nr:hypothetical protein [Deltaproteobacteria bacterium]
MKTINRTIITVKVKEPFVEWANSFDDGGPKMEIANNHPTAFLIPDRYDKFNYEDFLKKNFKIIFESELDSWMVDPSVWPQKRTYKVFQEWFDVQISDMVFDLAKGDVITESF